MKLTKLMEKIVLKVSRVFLIGSLLFAVFFGLFGLAMTREIAGNRGSEAKLTAVTLMDSGEGVVQAEQGLDMGAVVVTGSVEKADARPLLIQRYLEKYKSPLAPYANLIFELSQNYGYDYYWIVAIGQQESNLCKKIPEDSHNCWGYGIHKKGTLRFENYELALRSYAEYLKREYFDKGLNTPELMMKKYCPSSNGSWAFGVQHFIDEIEAGKF